MLKKLMFVVAAVTGLSYSAFAAPQNIGAKTDAGRNAELIDVYNSDTGSSYGSGTVMVWKDGTYDGVEVSTTTSADDKLVAGVVPVGATLTGGHWGKLQVAGYHPAVKVTVATSAGDILATSTTGGKAKVASGAVNTYLGKTLEATTSSTTVKAFLGCR